MVRNITIPVLMLCMALCSCQKKELLESEISNSGKLTGTWLCLENSDTLVFIDNHTFIKELEGSLAHTFEYKLGCDSIKIQYKGPNKIYVFPTTHYYILQNNKLSLDFSNGCYGFDKRELTFVKQ